jgi:putative two-component system response regulator
VTDRRRPPTAAPTPHDGPGARGPASYPLPRAAGHGDVEAAGHVERVGAYAAVLANQLASHRRFRDTVDGRFVRRIVAAAALHDAGKAGVPYAVLCKPAALNDWESALVRRHTTLGAELLERSLADHPDAAFRELAVEIALTHHERWDGTGYPRGLAGDQIPVGGRIVAVADVYDALTSARAYKAAFPHELAKGVILRDRGTHFDPAVVDAFVAAEGMLLAVAGDHAVRRAAAA